MAAQLEMVPERWPPARISFSLQKCVEHLTEYWLGVAGKFMPQPPSSPSTKSFKHDSYPLSVATVGAPLSPVGRKPDLQGIRTANATDPVTKAGARS